MQVQVEILSNAGTPPNRTVTAPGIQGVTVAGTQGMGVSTPKAAVVAAATAGLAGDMHIPKVGMFTIGTWSMMLAAGVPMKVLLVGNTASALGAAPNVQAIMDPAVTNIGIRNSV